MEIQDKHIASVQRLLVDSGLLFKINHEFLFPLGLALVHVVADAIEGEAPSDALVIADISGDYEEGYVANVKQFREYQEKLDSPIFKELLQRMQKREELLGYTIQPLPGNVRLPQMPVIGSLTLATGNLAQIDSPVMSIGAAAEQPSTDAEAQDFKARNDAARARAENRFQPIQKVGGAPTSGVVDREAEISPVYTKQSVATCPHPISRRETVHAGTGSVSVCLDCGGNMEDIRARE